MLDYSEAAARLGILAESQAADRTADQEAAEAYQRAQEDKPATEWAPSGYGAGDYFDPRPDGVDASNEDPADGIASGSRGGAEALAFPRGPASTEEFQEALDRAPRARPPRRRSSVSDDVRSFYGDVGTSWTTTRTTNPDLPEACRFCGDRLVTPAEEFPCEFAEAQPAEARTYRAQPAGLPVRLVEFGSQPRQAWRSRPVVRSGVPLAGAVPGRSNSGRPCGCNGCRMRQEGIRKRGGQPRQCGKPECRKALRKEQNDRNRNRERARQRERAAEWIAHDPALSDVEIADQIGSPKIRVREAREILSS